MLAVDGPSMGGFGGVAQPDESACDTSPVWCAEQLDLDALSGMPELAWPQPATAASDTPTVAVTYVDEVAQQAIQRLKDFVFGGGVQPWSEEAVWQWHPLVIAHFPSDSWETALCVMSYESSGDPTVTYANPGDPKPDGIDSVGLFQIDWDNLAWDNRIAALDHWGYHTRTEAETLLLGPEANVRAAALMHADEGWLPGWRAQQTRCGLTD